LNLRFDHIPLSFFLLRREANESGQSVTIVRFISNGRTMGGREEKKIEIKMEDNHTMAEMERNKPPFSLGIKKIFLCLPFDQQSQ
jgi:hypothetical protein